MRTSLILGVVTALALALVPRGAEAKVRTKTVEYKQGDTVLEGILAWNDAQKGKRPGVLVVHEWTGVNANVKRRAEMLAGLGYVAFAADIYGKGVRPTPPKEAGEVAGKYKADRPLLRARVQAGLDVLKADPMVDPTRLAAIGYCFGGTTVLELARSGAPVAGVVSFHGGLATPTPADAKNIKGKVLVLHGAEDSYVPEKEVAAFHDEMVKGGVDYQIFAYGGAVHGFTNPEAGTDVKSGYAYDAKADARSWLAMQQFFAELFGKSAKPAPAKAK